MPLDPLFDASRRAPRLAGRGLVKAYRYTFSPLVGFHCRHLPTCSDYADQAIDRYGLWAGGWMTLARLLRCQPWGTAGLDFVAVVLALALRALARDEFGAPRGRAGLNTLAAVRRFWTCCNRQLPEDLHGW
jgi:putative membrane protein insertion efficiency factor